MYKKAFEQIRDHYVWIKNIRYYFHELYENENNRNNLIESANDFWCHINTVFIHQLILSYCRITDSCEKFGPNLTLDYFYNNDDIEEESRIRLETLHGFFNEFRKYIIPARNKLIAHNDLKVYSSLEKCGEFPDGMDIEYLENIEKYINELSIIIYGENIGDIVVAVEGDVLDLLKCLQAGVGMTKWFNNEKDPEIFQKICENIGVYNN